MANGYSPQYVNPTPGQTPEVRDSETYSKIILGPTFFEMYDLRVEGQAGLPTPPVSVQPGQSSSIVASDEEFVASVKIKFNNSPLTKLLLCLGIQIKVCFSFEGFGKKASEKDLEATVVTEKDNFYYVVTYTGTPESAELTPGFYAISAIAEIGPGNHPCAQYVFGFGYVAKALLQVYQAF
ncbi:MAG: hypothetical protein WA919_11515 [Coleofasciculaceae cyanobacterium]